MILQHHRVRASRTFRTATAWAVAVCLCLPAFAVRAQESAPGDVLGRPGFLVLESARRDTADFHWVAGPEPGRRSLVWEEGRLEVPDSTRVETFGAAGLGVACGPGLRGSGPRGRLVFRDGRYPVKDELRLDDGTVSLVVTGGELEIRGSQLRYRRLGAVADARRQKSNLLLLAGVVLAVVVLLRRARAQRTRSRRP